jgi:hypothetical protein
LITQSTRSKNCARVTFNFSHQINFFPTEVQQKWIFYHWLLKVELLNLLAVFWSTGEVPNITFLRVTSSLVKCICLCLKVFLWVGWTCWVNWDDLIKNFSIVL